MDETNVPDEALECKFYLVDEDYFTVDYDMVEVDYIDVGGKHRENEQKRWTISDGDLERELIEEDVQAVWVVLKDEYRDEVPELPSTWIRGDELDEQ